MTQLMIKLTEVPERAAKGAAQHMGVLSALVLLVSLLWIVEPRFGTTGNITNILETNAVLSVVAVGLTFVLLTGAFDLSVGGMVAIGAVIYGELLVAGVPPGFAILLVVGLGAALGFGNGLIIARGKLNFFVATLATASIFRGLALLRTTGRTTTLYDHETVREIGSGRLYGVPYLVMIAVAIYLIGILVLRYSGYGRMIYAVGGSPEASRLAGINVSAIRASTFVISAALAAFASTLEVGRLAGASPTQGAGLELQVGAAVLLGGTSFHGGSGSLFGTALGVLFLGVLSNGLAVAGISSFWQGIVTGLVLLIAAALDTFKSD